MVHQQHAAATLARNAGAHQPAAPPPSTMTSWIGRHGGLLHQ
jgi:hypothetical protein